MPIPKSLIEKKPQNKAENVRFTLELILTLKERDDLLIIVVDDFHLLAQNIQKDIKLLFQHNYMDGKLGLITFARPEYQSDEAHHIVGFSKSEYNELIASNISLEWQKTNKIVCDWIYTLTNGHPFQTKLFIDNIVVSGVSDQIELTIDDIKLLNIPAKLMSLIELKIGNSLENEQLKELLYSLSLVQSGLTFSQIKKIKNNYSNIENEINQNIIVEQNGVIDYFHPLLKEFILKKIPPEEKDLLIKKLIQLFNNDESDEKYYLLKQIQFKTKKQTKLIIDFSQQLAIQSNNYLAIKYLKSIDNHMEDPYISSLLGEHWAAIGNLENAKKHFDVILNHPKHKHKIIYTQNIIFYLIKSNDFDYAIELLELCIKTPNKVLKPKLYFLLVAYIWVMVRKYNWDKIAQLLKLLKKYAEYDINAKINYYKAIILIPDIYPEKINRKKIFKEAIDYAIKHKKISFSAQFSHSIMCYYIKNNQPKLVQKYYDLTKKYARDSFSIDVEKSLDEFYSVHLILEGDSLNGINLLSQNGNLKNYDFINSTHALFKTKLEILLSIGKKSILENIQKHIENDSNLVDMNMRYYYEVYASYYFLNNQPPIAIPLIQKGMDICIKNNLNHVELQILDIATSTNEIDIQQKINIINNHKFNYYGYFYFILYYTHLKKLKKNEILNLNFYKGREITNNIFFRNILLVMDFFRRGELGKGMTLLSVVEHNFNGLYLFYYYLTYDAISKVKNLPKAFNVKINNIKTMLHYIIHHDLNPPPNTFKVQKKGFGFERLIQNWYLCLVEKRDFNESEFNFFTNDFEKINYFKMVFNFWGIKVVDSDDIIQLKTLYINILGNISIVFSGRNKSENIENKLTQFQSTIFFYILLHKSETNQVSVKKIMDEFYPEKPMVTSMKNINIHLSRINSIFKPYYNRIFKVQNEQVQIDENIRIVLDTDRLESLLKLGEINTINNNWEKARLNYEVCFHLYQGKLLAQLDQIWLEKFRSYYLQKYIEIVDSLIAVYEEINLPALKIELLRRAIHLHPYVDEFKEYLDECLANSKV